MSSRHGPNARRLTLPTPLGRCWFRKHLATDAATRAMGSTILPGMRKGGLGVWWSSTAIYVAQTSQRQPR
jgi:hypothetical protein